MPASLEKSTPQYESWLTLKNGREVFLRPIRQTDGHLLVELFKKMSPQSLYLRFLWRVPALSEEMLYRFTHINHESEFALVCVIEDDGRDTIIAVGRYAYDSNDNISDLAVAVRDDWQHLGLGKSLLARTAAIGKEHGISRFKSMMDPRNEIMRGILLNLGYEVKYSMRDGFLELDILV